MAGTGLVPVDPSTAFGTVQFVPESSTQGHAPGGLSFLPCGGWGRCPIWTPPNSPPAQTSPALVHLSPGGPGACHPKPPTDDLLSVSQEIPQYSGNIQVNQKIIRKESHHVQPVPLSSTLLGLRRRLCWAAPRRSVCCVPGTSLGTGRKIAPCPPAGRRAVNRKLHR